MFCAPAVKYVTTISSHESAKASRPPATSAVPTVGTALVAGALLAFALSWDEIVVTYFTAGAQNTLPLLLFGFIRQGQNLPIVNAIALVVIVVSAIPVWIAQRLTSGSGGSGRGVGS